MSLKEKLYDWKNKLKNKYTFIIIAILVIIIIAITIFSYNKEQEYKQISENSYNMAFYELVDYVQNVEVYLAKSLISTTPEHGAQTLTHLWREADLAQTYLAQLPVESQELANTSKFLHQVSDYSYSLSQKNIYNEELSQEDLDNLTSLHEYSVELKNTLNQLSEDLNNGRISWSELTQEETVAFAQQVSNISQDSFTNLEESFHEYSGLIYDGAFSEHMTNPERKGLTGDDIDEETAKTIATEYFGENNIEEITLNGISENGNISSYDLYVKLKNQEENANISISQKGGHIVYANYNRNIEAEVINEEQANKIGKEFLSKIGFQNMTQTYYLKQEGILTINYAYEQDGVIMYPDLIKLKVALDNGEILGIETTGYLNSHEERTLSEIKISSEDAKKTLNKNLEIESQRLAVIPTEYQTEILCWEFKGTVGENEFLVYINVENGREEDILVVQNTPNGTLTM